uniref:Uncharacterized protein n=1 Tax=Romanomermis culicivorax TaxID=13658 RepID=A0A915K0W4_ROMCU
MRTKCDKETEKPKEMKTDSHEIICEYSDGPQFNEDDLQNVPYSELDAGDDDSEAVTMLSIGGSTAVGDTAPLLMKVGCCGGTWGLKPCCCWVKSGC